MNRSILFRPAARQELLDACAWYERQRTGLGSRFEAVVAHALERIAESPEAFPRVHHDVRRVLLRRFPYGVFYRIRGEAIHVLAVMHGHRDPAIWKSRADAE